MKKVKFITNIPSPYRIDFFNELGKNIDLTVVFEAERNYALNEDWYTGSAKNFKSVFLKEGAIEERKINFKILKHVKKDQDVLIFSNYSYFTEMVGLIWAKIRRIPYWMELDGALLHEESKLKYLWKSFLIKGAEKYMSTSENTDEFLMHYGVTKEKIQRYPFSSLLETDVLKEPPTQEQKIELKRVLNITEPKMIIAVGRFVQCKGFDILMKSAKNFEQEIGVYIIGGKPVPEYLELKEKWNLQNVHFVDFMDKEKLKKYYQAADLFVLPTRGDVWGLVVNEAMANGLPVLTTDRCVAGIELIQNGVNGYIVPVDNAQEIGRCVAKFFDHATKQSEMARNALQTISEYTIEKMAEAHRGVM